MSFRLHGVNDLSKAAERFAARITHKRWILHHIRADFSMASTSESVTSGLKTTLISMSWAEKLKSREFVELAILYGLVLITEWTVLPVEQILFWVTLAWVVATTIRARQSARDLGLRPANLRQSVWVAAAALAFAAVAVWIAAERHTLHDFEFTMLAGWRFWGYVVWTFVQEFLLQDYFLFRLLRLLPNKRMAIVTAALLFAGAHIPNPLLMVATLVWGILACALFLRYRDLYSLGLAQGVLGICIAVTIPGALHHQMHVGRGYYDYRQHTRSSALLPPKRPDRVRRPMRDRGSHQAHCAIRV